MPSLASITAAEAAGGQAGDDEVAVSGHFGRAVGPFSALVEERPGGGAVEVAHGQVMAVA
jgi:hypothetical protein